MTDSIGFTTIAAEIRAEPEKTKGSRHIGTAVPIAAEGDVAPVLDRLRAEFPTANHHAYAWRLGRDGEHFYYSDDGEPSGSAGRPILQHIDGRGVTHVLVVVSRIFGGTKLGVGGLVRAYGGAAAAVLAAADVVHVVPRIRVRVTFPYECSSAMQAWVHGRDVQVVDAAYEATVSMILEVPEHEAADARQGIRDATAGRARIEPEG